MSSPASVTVEPAPRARVLARSGTGPPNGGGRALHRSRHRAKHIAARTAGYTVLVVMSILCIFPLVWMVITSLRPNNTVLSGATIPARFTFSAYRYVIRDVHIFHFFVNSLFITAATVLLVLVIGNLGGYGFGRLWFRGKGFLFGLLATALFLPAAAVLIPLFLELKRFHLLSSQIGLILAYVGGAVPFAIFLLRVFYEGLPNELSDAARIDGAGELQVFWKVMFPLSAPAVATVAIFQILGTWNELMFANALIQKQNLLPLQPELNQLVGQYSTNWSALTAALTITVIPVIIAFILLQKRVVAGLTSGALKG